MPRTKKEPEASTAPRPTLILSSHVWRDRLAQELVAVGVGHEQARLVAVRVLKAVVAGERGEPEDA